MREPYCSGICYTCKIEDRLYLLDNTNKWLCEEHWWNAKKSQNKINSGRKIFNKIMV